MATPYVGEIRLVGFNFAPVGWLSCNGQSLSISQYQALFALIGTTYGGNGVTTFNAPDLQGRMPVSQGTSSTETQYIMGGAGGEEVVALTTAQLPAHTHSAACNATPTATTPANNVWAGTAADAYSSAAPTQTMNPAAVSAAGGGVPHNNLPPFLVANFIIATAGVFPS